MESTYPVLISYSNYGYSNFAINLIENFVLNVKNHKLNFYCLDDKIYNLLNNKYKNVSNINFELFQVQNISENFQNYGSTEYNKITNTKVNILKNALEKFNFIHFIDCDVVCVREPQLEYYDKYKDKDIVFQFDVGLGHGHIFYTIWVCTGNTLIRNTKGTKYILETIEKYQNIHNKNDQECLFQYFKDNNITDITTEKNAKLDVFPYEEYTNGWMIKNNAITLKDTYFFHANHVVGNSEKINLLKSVGFWYN